MKKEANFENRIKQAIIAEKKLHKHSCHFLARELNIAPDKVVKFFASHKGAIEIANKLLSYYKLQIVKIL